MVVPQKRSAVLALWDQGRHKRHIARLLELDVKTVRTIIATHGQPHERTSRSRPLPPRETLAELYRRCGGYMHRMHEILTEEQGCAVGYSTLTRALRRLGIVHGSDVQPSEHVPDVPGQEMQHDTTVYRMALGDNAAVNMVCSGLYLRYSKMRYVKFYRTFNRFRMKCFFDEALRFWGYCARDCIIDNTSLAVVAGCGADALFAPEMVAFANNYGFRWVAHALGHANRKAGTERNFWTVESSFLPGRSFASLEDMNAQAFQWATVRYAQRPQSHTGLIPVQLFEHEKTFLRSLPPFIVSPSLPHRRTIDAYGYIRFDTNFYWIPHRPRSEVSIIQYADHIVVYAGPQQELIRYPLPPDGVQKQVFHPPGKTGARREPRNLKKDCQEEERLLRRRGQETAAYLDFIKSAACHIRYKHHFLRELFDLSRTCDDTVFVSLMRRARAFRVQSLSALLRMAVRLSSPQATAPSDLPTAAMPQDYQQRPAYLQGEFSREHDSTDILDHLSPSSGDTRGTATA